MRQRRRFQRQRGIGRQGIVGCDPWPEDGAEDQQGEQAEGEQRDRVLGKHIADMAESRDHASKPTRGSITQKSTKMARLSATYFSDMVSTKIGSTHVCQPV